MKWTAEQDVIVRSFNRCEAARQLGVSHSAVVIRAHQLGLVNSSVSKKASEKWSKEMDSILGTAKDNLVAQVIGLTSSEVSNRRRRLSIESCSRGNRTLDQLNTLWRLIHEISIYKQGSRKHTQHTGVSFAFTAEHDDLINDVETSANTLLASMIGCSLQEVVIRKSTLLKWPVPKSELKRFLETPGAVESVGTASDRVIAARFKVNKSIVQKLREQIFGKGNKDLPRICEKCKEQFSQKRWNKLMLCAKCKQQHDAAKKEILATKSRIGNQRERWSKLRGEG